MTGNNVVMLSVQDCHNIIWTIQKIVVRTSEGDTTNF